MGARAEAGWLDDLLRGIAEGAPWLARGKPDRFQTAVAQRMAPPRPDRNRPAPEPEPETAPAEDRRSPLQKLVDRFR